MTSESKQIVSIVDGLPRDEREGMLATIKYMAELYRVTGDVPPPDPRRAYYELRPHETPPSDVAGRTASVIDLAARRKTSA